jgi:hypothetical protein
MDEADPIRVRLVYGTSQDCDAIAASELRIGPENQAAYALAGLSWPTKFCARNIVVLDYTDHWFALAPGIPLKPTPKLGILHPTLLAPLAAALKAAGVLPE